MAADSAFLILFCLDDNKNIAAETIIHHCFTIAFLLELFVYK